jgi:putative ABC transport system permease protein
LKPGANTQHIEQELQRLSAQEIQSTNARKLSASFHLQPLTSIHLQSSLDGEMQINGNGKVVTALFIIALLILLLAIINYVVLALSRFLNRTKEIGVRKIIGSSRSQLTSLLLTESVLVNSIAFVCGVALAMVLLPYISSIVNKEIPLTIPVNPFVSIAFSALAIIAISFIAVFYPARILANHNPAVAVKSISLGNVRKSAIRRGLVFSQFLITQLLVAGTLLFYNQFNFILHRPLGFDVKQTIVFRTLGSAERDSIHLHQLNVFKTRVRSLSSVKNLTMTSTIPGRHNEWVGRLMNPNQGDAMITAVRTRVDSNFIDTYGLTLLAGTNFISEDAGEVILN